MKYMRKGSNSLVSLNVDGVTLSNDLSIVESMNDFFSSVFTSEDCDNFPEFEYVTNCKLSNILCNTKEVEKLLRNLDIYKSPGPDSLPPRILKECASVLSSPLCFFFNKSFSTGKLPHLWKLANITPLFKKGSTTDRNNYRQISLTSIVCNITEKIIKSQVMHFWRDINILNPNQFAYMEGRSTLSELLSCYDDWAKSRNNRKPTDITYLDFSNNTVPHLRNHTLVKKKKTAECYSGDSDEGVEQRKKATVHHITNSIVKEGIHRND